MRAMLEWRDIRISRSQNGFTITAIKTIDEGIALLTGLEAGEKDADGRFGAETVNGRVEARLKTFAERARLFASAKSAPQGAGAGTA